MKRLTAIFAGVIMLASSCAWADGYVTPETFPDEVFGLYIFENYTDGSGLLTDATNATITELDLTGMGIYSLEGIQYLTALKVLKADNNNLASVNLSSNDALIEVSCSSQTRPSGAILSSGNSAYP